MLPANEPLPVICLGGPTGCGKTGLAVRLARELDAEIINADSRQVYADFPIITAQPTLEEQENIPHHLYGFLPPWEKAAAGQWQNLAAAQAAEIIARGRVPLLVGGSGFYFQTLLRGIAAIPPIPPEIAEEVANRLQAQGPIALHGQLREIDPHYAARIHPNDRQRIGRALEVWRATGRTFSWWHARPLPPPLARGPLLVLEESGPELARRLERRIEQMLKSGALAEAERARRKCPSGPAWNGIGCAELKAFLEGRLGMDACRDLWLKNTRAYAKRQRTWFHGRDEAIFIGQNESARALEIAREFRRISRK